MVSTAGRHIILDVWGVDKNVLDDMTTIAHLLKTAAQQAQATVLNSYFHEFEPTGITGMVVIAESHIAIHTWPEDGYASIDVYTCGENSFPQRAVDHILNELKCAKYNMVDVLRGIEKVTVTRGSTLSSFEYMTSTKGGVNTYEAR